MEAPVIGEGIDFAQWTPRTDAPILQDILSLAGRFPSPPTYIIVNAEVFKWLKRWQGKQHRRRMIRRRKGVK